MILCWFIGFLVLVAVFIYPLLMMGARDDERREKFAQKLFPKGGKI